MADRRHIGINTPLIRHVLVIGAVVAGIAGMGTIFSGIMRQNARVVEQGVPLLLLGLWWAGHELGRSITAARTRNTANR